MDQIPCQLGDIVDGDARAFDSVDRRLNPTGLFVVRRGTQAYCYVNDCPHLHITLDFLPGRFMNKVAGLIQCANHGARFEIQTSEWGGACRGDALMSLPIRIANGTVILEAAP